MVEALYLNPFTRFHVAALALQHDKAVAQAEGAENVRTLVPGRADFQLTLRVMRQNAALEIKPTRRFFQARRGAHAQAFRQRAGGVAGKLRQQRDHQLVKGECR